MIGRMRISGSIIEFVFLYKRNVQIHLAAPQYWNGTSSSPQKTHPINVGVYEGFAKQKSRRIKE